MAETAELDVKPDGKDRGDGPVRETTKLQQILEGAWHVFLRDGFDAASMNDIARSAGVSKGTLYVYFASKEALFHALVRHGREQQAERFLAMDDLSSDLASSLRQIGSALLRMLLSPDHMAHLRMVIAASAKLPAIGQTYYEAGPCHGAWRLSTFLDEHVAAGRLRCDNTEQASFDFINMCQGRLLKEAMFGVRNTADDAEILANVDHAVALFLGAYASRDLASVSRAGSDPKTTRAI